MPLSVRPCASPALLFVCASLGMISGAQAPQPDQPPVTATLPSGIDRLAGTDASSHIQFVRLILKGVPHTTASPAKPSVVTRQDGTPPPLLIAQCTLRPSGKYVFELFASFGGPIDLTYYPPWTSASSGDLFPPRTEKATLTMDFLGYTHVKPLRRQWEVPVQTPGVYRYNSPGRDSTNLEEIAYDLRYLLALPTLRLTLDNPTKTAADFLTTPLLDEVRKEHLCRAAGI